MQTLLTKQDSKRVADALIEKIEEADFDISPAVYDAIRSVVKPISRNGWVEDWFPFTIEEMCNKISSGIIESAYSAQKNR